VGEVQGLVCEMQRLVDEVQRLVGEMQGLVGEVQRLVGEVQRLVDEVQRLVGEVPRLRGKMIVLADEIWLSICEEMGASRYECFFGGAWALSAFAAQRLEIPVDRAARHPHLHPHFPFLLFRTAFGILQGLNRQHLRRSCIGWVEKIDLY